MAPIPRWLLLTMSEPPLRETLPDEVEPTAISSVPRLLTLRLPL
jgi:hypothetical protein